MAISDTRQRNMPSVRDRASGQPLAYPEAVLLTNSSEQQFKGEVTLLCLLFELTLFFFVIFVVYNVYGIDLFVVVLGLGG